MIVFWLSLSFWPWHTKGLCGLRYINILSEQIVATANHMSWKLATKEWTWASLECTSKSYVKGGLDCGPTTYCISLTPTCQRRHQYWSFNKAKFLGLTSYHLIKVAQSCLTICDPWTVAHQAPPSMGFSRQEYWSGLPFPSPGDLPDPGIEPRSPTLQADALTSAPPGKPLKTRMVLT